MYLDSQKVLRANVYNRFLKKQPDIYFTTHEIEKCDKCERTGLDNFGKMKEGGYHWDGKSFCDRCSGIGYIGVAGGVKLSDTDYICRNCDGQGCAECNEGVVDWIAHMMGR